MATIPDLKNLELSVTDFGPIAKGKIDLRPLTVFVGPSNTGKSYLAILVYALHQFFSAYSGRKDFSSFSFSHVKQRQSLERKNCFHKMLGFGFALSQLMVANCAALSAIIF